MGDKVSKQALPQRSRPYMSLVPTGVPYLDEALGGGMPQGALAIVVGTPGSGKTTLACQMAFATAQAGGSALVLTALSETSTKLIAHLRGFRFFDPTQIGQSIQFLSMEHFLRQGLDATADEMVAITRKSRASLVVLDGFRGVRESEMEAQSARRFLYSVGARLGVLGTTTVITSEAQPRDPEFFTEATTADVIVGLHYSLEGVRQRRGLEVIKVRGSKILPGLHGFELTDRGAQVFPRLEARVVADGERSHLTSSAPSAELAPQEQEVEDAKTSAEERHDTRARFDLPGLDMLLGGGLIRDTSTVVIGSSGSGKTLLALHFALAGVAAQEPVVYVSLREPRGQLLRIADMFTLGASLRAALAQDGGLVFQGWDPVEINPDVIAERIISAIDRVNAQRVVIDSIGEVEHAISRSGDAGRITDYLAALRVAFRRRGITALIVKEISPVAATLPIISTEPVSVLSENVLKLQQENDGAELRRSISVTKMRFSAYDARPREFTISSPAGITVEDGQPVWRNGHRGHEVSDLERDVADPSWPNAIQDSHTAQTERERLPERRS